MKPGAPDHPKTELLAELLGTRRSTAVGILELLIHFTSRYAPRGEIGRFSDAMIAKRVDWLEMDGTPEKLVEALETAGWIDRHPVHRYVLHDWPDHAPDYTKRKSKERGGWAVDDQVVTNGVASPQSDKDQKIPENSDLPFPSFPSPPLPFHSLPSQEEGAIAPRADDPLEGYKAKDLNRLIDNTPESLKWLEANLKTIVADAHVRLLKSKVRNPTRADLTTCVKRSLHAFWGWQRENPDRSPKSTLSPTQAREERGRAAALKVIKEPSV